MTVEVLEMVVPVRGVVVPHRVERFEDRQLDVRVDPVHERDPTVRQVEHHRVLVADVLGSDHAAAVPVQLEASVLEVQPMHADPPRQARPRGGQVRVRHHDLRIAVAANDLHARILEHVVAVRARGREHVAERVVDAVARREHQDVGDVVQELRSLARVRVIPIANAAGEQVVDALVDQEARVEDRVVAGDRTCLHDRPMGKSGDERREGLWLLHTSAGGYPRRRVSPVSLPSEWKSEGLSRREIRMVHEVDPRELFSRYEGNPIIKPAAFPRMVNAAFNPAAVMFEGQTLLLMRVEDRTGLSRLVVATSDDGFTDWEIDHDRSIVPDLDCFEEQWGVEDPRITRDDDGGYLIVYTGYSPGGPLVCLATTNDFRTFKKRGVIQSPEDKDAALLPRKFGGRWGLIHRPASRGAGHGAHIWMSWSPDLRHWGDSQILLPARRGAWWDADKIGLGPPPLLTDQGWLVCYHGVRVTVSGSIYRLGSGAPRPRRSHRGDRPGQRVGLRAPHDLRAIGRRPRRRVPVRLDPGRGRRHGTDVLRSRGQRRLRRDRQRPRAPRTPVEPPGDQGFGGATARLRLRVSVHAPRLPWPPASTAFLERE